MSDWSRIAVAPEVRIATVTGPRAGQIHYVHLDSTSPVEAAYCGKAKPRYGWHVTSDAENNSNRAGFCERCMRKAPY